MTIVHSPPATPSRIPCSVVVLTLNEERNLDDCLASVTAFDDLHVLDSGSTDGTHAIAARHGAHVGVNRFTSFGDQRNWGHDHLPLRHDWVLHLDADERMNVPLAEEITRTIAADDGSLAGHFIAERTWLGGQWLRHAGQYPRYQARLVHRARMRFVDHGHGQREHSALPFGRLSQPYEHLAFSHGMEHWLKKHAGYAAREAALAFGDATGSGALLAALAGGDALARRRALKALTMRLPARPFLRWCYVYLIRRGFLDGAAGWQYASMMRTFQTMIDLCMSELESARRADAPSPGQGEAGRQ